MAENLIHVVHLTSVHPAGDTRIFVKECCSLAKAGYRVTLIAVNAKEETICGVETISVSFSGNRWRRVVWASRMVYRKALQLDADFYHLHDPELLPYGVKLAKKGKKVIYDSHEDLPRQILTKHYLPGILRKMISRLAEFFENRMVKKISGVIAATPIIRDRFLNENIFCADVCNFPSLDDMPKPVNVEKKERIACYIGSITEVRGIREKVAAMDGADFTLQLAGIFSPPLLEQEMHQQPGWKNIRFDGFVNRQGIRQLLDRSMVGLVTLRPVKSFSEALPVKMFEYMAAGIPVVATDIPLWTSIIDEAHCGIAVDIFNPKQLQSAIRSLLDHPDIAQQMGLNGRKAVEEKYNWAHEEKKLLAFYKKIGDNN